MPNNQPNSKPSLMERFKNRSRPRRAWVFIMGGAVLAGCFTIVFAFIQLTSSTEDIEGSAKTASMRDDVESTPGGDASEEYRKKMKELNKRQAESAERENRSHVSSVAGQLLEQDPSEQQEEPKKDEPEDTEDTDPLDEQQQGASKQTSGKVDAMEKRMRDMQESLQQMQRQQQQQQRADTGNRQSRQPQRDPANINELSEKYSEQMSGFRTDLEQDYAKQETQVFNIEDAEEGQQKSEQAEMQASATDSGSDDGRDDQKEQEEPGLGINPGDLLYARNDVRLNSDTPGPVQATVLSGDHRGAKLIGSFEKTSDYLRVEFKRMILPSGEDFKIEAVAIDPDVSASAVRSDVDRRILSRWGGLMAASFISGFGEATRDSGGELSVSDGSTLESRPELDTEEQLWSAAGRVGEELSSVLKKNFERPSTVTLNSGANLGILFLSVE